MSETTERLDAITERVAAATPGRWYCEGQPGEVKAIVKYTSANGVSVGTFITDIVERDEDAEFIANAPTDVAYLLDLARKQAATLERVEALAEEWRYKGEHGWGAWQEGYGPDPEGYALDGASADLRAAISDALEPTS